MIACKEAVARLWVYLDRNLGRLEERELDEHLGVCRHCCGELEFAERLRAMLRQPSRAAELTPETRARIETFVKGLERVR